MANLLLYSPELRKYASTIAGIWKIEPKEQKEFESLNDMAKEIGKFQTLDQLVIFTHGAGGQISLEDGNVYSLRQKEVADALAKVKTKVSHIRFEGCWVGEKPDDMAVFAGLLNASKVSAFTWEHFFDSLTVQLDKDNTPATVKTALGPFLRWLAPFPPVSLQQLASLGKNGKVDKTLMIEWFQYAGDEKHTPPWEAKTVGNLPPHGYKIRSEAENVTVKAKDAKPLKDVPTPHQYITVEM